MEKILISACLIGDKCRYDGKSSYSPFVKSLLEKYELVPFCGEVEGGLGVPRPAAEIIKNEVKNIKGHNVTRQYELGAQKGADIVSFLGIKIAILKERSPMCGVHQIHNGKFDGKIVSGEGILTRKLKSMGVRVISEDEIEAFLAENE